MEVLLFQIGIFITIFLIGAFGTRARMFISIAIGVFTLFAVFMSWLAILQFFTIFIAYSVSESLADPNSEDDSYNFTGCLKTIFIFIFLAVVISLLMETCNSKDDSSTDNKNTKTDSLNQPTQNSDDSKIVNPSYYSAYDTVENTEPEVVIDTMKNNYQYNDEDENVFGQE